MTAWALAALTDGADPSVEAGLDRQVAVAGSEVDERAIRSRAAAESSALEELSAADWFAGEPLRQVYEIPTSSPMSELAGRWKAWNEAHRLIVALLDIDRGLETEDITRLEAAAGSLRSLRDEYAKSPPRGSGPMMRVVDERIERLQTRISQIKRRNEATGLLASARAHFQQKRYVSCVEACDQLLLEFAGVFPPEIISKVRTLRKRADFFKTAMELQKELRIDRPLPEHRQTLDKFLAAYAEDDGLTSSQRDVLIWVRGELARLEAEIDREARQQAATQQMLNLRNNLPEAFVDRVRRAAEIIEAYPSEDVRESLRTEAYGWVAENLPQKTIDESPQLQEVETRDGQILRGFFKEVRSGDDEVYGYKCYETHRELLKPTSAVGTHRADDLVGSPDRSVPRRVLERYATTRDELLRAPHRRERWLAMAGVCRELEAELAAYRAKPGASREPLSFAEEAGFVEGVLESRAIEDLATLRGD